MHEASTANKREPTKWVTKKVVGGSTVGLKVFTKLAKKISVGW
jgi:hypothetical protein